MFDEIDTGWHGHGKALRIGLSVLLPVVAVAALLGEHYFLLAACVAALALMYRRYWALSLAGLAVGVGSALTPHRPEFANIADLVGVLGIFAYGLVLGLVLLVPPPTRRPALWLLLATLLIPAGCFGTAALRERVVNQDR